MAKHKESPRQKMIGVMYLVLTAMLALNVSKEVLDGFSVVNDSVLSTNKDFARKHQNAYANFEKEFSMNQIEVGPFWNKAKVAIRLSEDMIKYIADLRDELISSTEHIPLDSARSISFHQLKKKDDYTNPTAFLIGAREDGSKGRAWQLRMKINEYRTAMYNLVNPKHRDEIKIGLNTEGEYFNSSGKKLNWELHNFYEIPLAADIPILNKFIAEVNNAELEVVNGLLRESIAEDFKYDRIEAKVIPKTNYLFAGDQYEAEVIVAAYDTSHSPSPSVYLMRGADSLSSSERDKATLIARDHGRMNIKFPVSSLGLQKYAGFVSVPTHSGRERTYHFSSEFFVAQPSVTVSATNMNVLYIGVNNPVSLSVTGIPDGSISPTISSGTIRPSRNKGEWDVTVPANSKESTISVSVKANGVMRRMGSQTFRVKKLPDPTPFIANKKDGFINRASLIESGQIIARMPDDFEFNYTFQILSFKMTMQRGFNLYHYESQSNNLTEEMIQEIRKTNRGQVLIFEEIVARAPEGINRVLSPLYITIK
jgi:gliding motility-associated protein GldM